MSSNLQEEISYINTSLPMDLGRSQTLILSNNLEDI
jgi:hypothetical protein